MAIQEIERIDYKLPEVPHSLRAFVEKAARNDRIMHCLAEDPVMTLRANGVRISEDCFTENDFTRFITVIGKLRELVRSEKIAEDFCFEDIFHIAENLSYRSTKSSESMTTNTGFTPKTESTTTKETNQGQEKNFGGFGLPSKIDGRWITAPLLSPGDLREIVSIIDIQINIETD